MRQLSVLRLARLLRQSVHARTQGRESGAVATIVAALLGFGVILGCAVLTIDTGSILWERRQVQNGADAASLALAQKCAVSATCDPNSVPLVQLAGANAADGQTTVSSYCGSTGVANSLLPQCATVTGVQPLVECPELPLALQAPSVKYVEVRTGTQDPSNTSHTGQLRPIVSPGLPNNANDHGETVRACARAAWGPLGNYTATVPITFSYCEWQAATGYNSATGVGTYAPNPVYPTPAGTDPGYGSAGQPAWPIAAAGYPAAPVPGQEIIIYLQNHIPTNMPDPHCPNWQGHDDAGGFGYLQQSGCAATVTTGGWVQVQTGNNYNPCDLSTSYHKVVLLPVFDCMTFSHGTPTQSIGALNCNDTGVPGGGGPGGSNTWYHIQGFAQFYVSGFKTGGSQEMVRTATGTVPCSGGDRCLSGWFLQGLVPVGSIDTSGGSGPPLGVSVVQVAG